MRFTLRSLLFVTALVAIYLTLRSRPLIPIAGLLWAYLIPPIMAAVAGSYAALHVRRQPKTTGQQLRFTMYIGGLVAGISAAAIGIELAEAFRGEYFYWSRISDVVKLSVSILVEAVLGAIVAALCFFIVWLPAILRRGR